MRYLLSVAAVAAAALAVAACDKPRTQSAYNNSGVSATPAMPAEQAPSQTPAESAAQPMSSGMSAPAGPTAWSQAPAVSDTASPSTAPPPQGDAAAQAQSPAK